MDWYHLPFSTKNRDELLAAIAPYSLDYAFGLCVARALVPKDSCAKLMFSMVSDRISNDEHELAVMLLVELLDRIKTDIQIDPQIVAPDYADERDRCVDWADGFLSVVAASGAVHPWQSLEVTQALVDIATIARRGPGYVELAEGLPITIEQLERAWKPSSPDEDGGDDDTAYLDTDP
jgi:hypothetical protein